MSAGRMGAPAIDVEFPDLSRWAAGNTGVPYVWQFAAARPGPRVTVQALTHGNEVCGAIVNDWLLREDVRPVRGTLTLTFANIDAFRGFDAADPFEAPPWGDCDLRGAMERVGDRARRGARHVRAAVTARVGRST
jgi:hypothetical protein